MKRVVFTTLLLVLFFAVASVLPYRSFKQKDFNLADFGIKNSIIDTSKIQAALPTVFGGVGTWVTRCTCSPGFKVIIGPPRPAVLLYNPFTSIIFANYKITVPSSWAIGIYTPGGVCLMTAVPFCVSVQPPVQGTMIIVGTS